MNPLLTCLSEDHELILRGVSSLKMLWLQLEAPDLSLLLQIENELRALEGFLTFHHGIEENFLFPSLEPHYRHLENGPECGLHMTSHVLSPALAGAEARAASAGQSAMCSQARRDRIRAYQGAGSFLSIPLEEHEAGAIYRELLKNSLASQLRGSQAFDPSFSILLHSYLSLIRTHAEKEDRCLFYQADAVMRSPGFSSPHLAESIHREWHEQRARYSYYLSTCRKEQEGKEAV